MKKKSLTHVKTFLVNSDTDLVEKDKDGNHLYYQKY